MLTCVYQPPVSLTSKNCLIKMNRDTRKVMVSKFTEDKGGRVKVEVSSTHKTLNQLLRSKHKGSKGKHHLGHGHHHETNSLNNNEDSWESAYSSDSEPLSETCGLSISELEAMAARQARQLETQEQLLAAKAQRLRFLKSSGEAERLQRIREKVASQEERLRKLRALRGKVQTTRNGNSVLSADLESLRAVFNEKEKELSLAVAKVDELTKQLEDIRRTAKEQPTNGQSAAVFELEKLRRELMYRHKIRESQSNRVLNQKQTISQRQDEAMRVDRRIAELQERLHRKRVLNSQLAASLKHQENEEDFVSLPTKNDPKYQTLPYNAKLFVPFGSKLEEEQFEKSMQQMQIITQKSDQSSQLPFRQNNHQYNNSNQYPNPQSIGSNGGVGGGGQNGRVQSYNSKNTSNNLNQQLQNFLSHQQQNNQQVIQQNSKSANSINPTVADQNSSTSTITSSSSNTNTTSSSNSNAGFNGLQTVQQGSNSLGNIGNNENAFPIVRPSNFVPTGAPASSPSASSSSSSSTPGQQFQSFGNGFTSHQNKNTAFEESPGNGCEDDESQVSANERLSKPALPPKPAKPAPPPRQAQEFTFGARSVSSSDEIMMPDRSELPIKAKPLFVKNSQQQNPITSTISSSSTSGDKELIIGSTTNNHNNTSASSSSTGNGNTTVRVSINRRIEMPPAFLFPESDPPPLDLVPEQSSQSNITGPGSGNNSGGISEKQQQSQQLSNDVQNRMETDSTDSSPMLRINKPPSNGMTAVAEEYQLPDLFPNPPQTHNFLAINTNNNKDKFNNKCQQNNQHFNGPRSDIQMQQKNEANENASETPAVAQLSIPFGSASPNVNNEECGDFCHNMTDNQNNQHQFDKFETGNNESNGNNNLHQMGMEKVENTNIDSNSVTTNVPGVLRRVKKSNFKSAKRDHIPLGRRVSFDPLALLLDASLEGELELVMKTANEVGNVSAANDEGITALHNAICAGHAEVVRFLVEFGCDVNAQDSDGWTPLHCAASCNNVGMVKFLVEHGACIFATTLSDHETAAQKCEEDEDGFGPCSEYLYSIQEKLGIMNNGVVSAVFDYDAQNQDELSFRDGERLVIIRKGDEYEREWWWAAISERQGYVPRNLLGVYPRVVPQKRSPDNS